jgi:acetamidase/formamidase
MARFELAATPGTVHWGYLDATLPPALTVASGDEVTVHTCTGSAAENPPPDAFGLLPDHRAILAAVRPELGPHLLTGPVAVEGAEPGDTLEVRILDVRLRQDFGWNLQRPLLGTLPEDFPGHRLVHIPLDRARMTAELAFGVTLPLAPFFGVMGVAPPPAYGRVSSVEPREYGGNIDLKELTAGSTLFLPVFAPGALLSVGDGHAAQGDGEVNLTAIETALTGTFGLVLHKRTGLAFPRAETPAHHVTLGFDPDLDDAAKQALRGMIELLGELSGLGREDAYMLCSLAADLRVTQLVDGNKGVHCMIEKRLLPGVRQVGPG